MTIFIHYSEPTRPDDAQDALNLLRHNLVSVRPVLSGRLEGTGINEALGFEFGGIKVGDLGFRGLIVQGLGYRFIT